MRIITLGLLLLLFSCDNKKSSTIDKIGNHFKVQPTKIKNSFLKKEIFQQFHIELNTCPFSDHEVMQEDLKIAGHNNVILTIEPLTGKGSPLFYREIDLNSYSSQALKSELILNFKEEAGIYGVFICSDQGTNRSCIGKPYYDYTVITSNLLSKYSDKDKLKVDKIYYFNPVLVSANHLYPLKNEMVANALQLMKKSRAFQDIKSFEQINTLIDRHSITLGSYQINAHSEALQIGIGKMDPICDPELPREKYRNTQPLPLIFQEN